MLDKLRRADEVHNVGLGLVTADAVEPGTARAEVKGHVVVEKAAGRKRHGNTVAPVGQACIE